MEHIDSTMDDKFNARYMKGHLEDNVILHYGGGGARANLKDFRKLFGKYIDLTGYKGSRELVSCSMKVRYKNKLWIMLSCGYIPFGEIIYNWIMKTYSKISSR